MGFQVGRVDHHRLAFGVLGSQSDQDPGKHAPLAPALPAVVKGLVRTILLGRIAPPQAIAVDEDYPRENAPIIDPRLAVGLREEGFETRHLRVRQPEEIAHVTARFSSNESELHARIAGS